MASIAIPEDVAAHLQAAIQLSNRRVQLRLLQEAERALAEKLPIAAVVIANAVLESALEAIPLQRYVDHRSEIERWRTVRNSAAHTASSDLTLDQAAEIVRGVRDLVSELAPTTDASPPDRGITVNQVRGKYRHIQTSSTGFILRKADELGLEH